MHNQGPTNAIPSPILNVVLFQPQIPQNTGNIARSCVALGAKLWIVRPNGFRIDDAKLKRAGLDYWQHLDWESVDDWEQLNHRLDLTHAWYFSKFATQPHYEVRFSRGDTLVFGSETTGLPDSIKEQFASQLLKIPILGPVRSLNLSASVAVGMYEAYRQIVQTGDAER